MLAHDLRFERFRSPKSHFLPKFLPHLCSHVRPILYFKEPTKKKDISTTIQDEKPHLSHLILAIAATTSGLHKSFAKTFMVDEEEDASYSEM